MFEELSSAHFVTLFRSVAPYVNLFRGKTFVIAFGGKAISGPFARTLAYDSNLLAALGVIGGGAALQRCLALYDGGNT